MLAAYFTAFAAVAVPAFSVLARAQDSSNFLADTAPQYYASEPVYQITDGQPQNNPPATSAAVPVESQPSYATETAPVPPVYETSAIASSVVVVVPSSVVVPVETTAVVVTPVAPAPTEVIPVPVPGNSTVLPSSVAYPNSTLITASNTAPAATASTPPVSNAGATLSAFSSIGLVAVVAALFL